MAPPFLAYYAADVGNGTLLYQAIQQCGLYREIVQTPIVSNPTAMGVDADSAPLGLDTQPRLWKHIIGPKNQDMGIWSTGNAWAAAGMTRILATVIKLPQSSPIFNVPLVGLGALSSDDEGASTQVAGQVQIAFSWRDKAIDSLTKWIEEIIVGAMHSNPDNGLLRNYLDPRAVEQGLPAFGEVSGSTLLASVVYRMAVLRPDRFDNSRYFKWAEGIRLTLGECGHVLDDGRVVPAVNPLNWADDKPYMKGSPEGQNFVVLMYAAWRDCMRAGKCKL